MKILNKENFIRKYGYEHGIEMWNNYQSTYKGGYSKASINFIDKIVKLNYNNDKLYYGDNEKRFDIFNDEYRFVYVDLFNENTNKVVEFYGDYWHANPIFYKEDDIIGVKKSVVKDIWQKDKNRIDAIQRKFNVQIKIVWEHDSKNENVITETARWLYEQL